MAGSRVSFAKRPAERISREMRTEAQLPSRPLPFDTDLVPKSAFEAVARAFAHVPQRRADWTSRRA
jgi:hypothetical protein